MKSPKLNLLLLCLPTILFAQQKDTTAIRYSKNITAADMSKNLHVLASDEYEGRETGKKGQKMAAEYIAAQFKASGIAPYKNNSYYQEFPLNLIMPSLAEITVDGNQFVGNKDYYNFPGLSEQKIEATEILGLGYGIDESNYSDYKDVDAKGKMVVVFSGEPLAKDSVSLITGKKATPQTITTFRTKTENARQKGVAVLFIVVDDIEKALKENKHRLESSALKLEKAQTEEPKKEMVVIYISQEMAKKLLKVKDVNKIRFAQKPQIIKAKTKVSINVKNNIQKITSENVLAYVEGSDLKEELIVITAHYDHIGMNEKEVFNGADDDGSGTVAVIEMADAFAKAKREGHGPRRSMLFMTVAGEEKGLLGSAYYVEHPEFPLKNTVCDLNIDMIGRLDKAHETNSNYVYLIGSDKLSSQLHNISENANKLYTNLELDYTFNDEKDKNRFYYRSDHYNFAKKGIPVIFYFNGVHEDYHKESDEVEKIDFNKMEKITRLVFFTAWDLANRNERIVVDSNKK